jgi:hypothetical protein
LRITARNAERFKLISRTDFAELVGRSELPNILAVYYLWIVFVVAEANQEFTDMNEICVEHVLQLAAVPFSSKVHCRPF